MMLHVTLLDLLNKVGLVTGARGGIATNTTAQTAPECVEVL